MNDVIVEVSYATPNTQTNTAHSASHLHRNSIIATKTDTETSYIKRVQDSRINF